MGLEQIVCLANSYKHDHRCVAGIRLKAKEWVRLVGKTVPGCVTVREATCVGGKEAALLDVIEAELGDPCGSGSHPEDRFITGTPWRHVRRFDQREEREFLTSWANRGPSVLEGCVDRIYAKKIANSPVKSSLELVRPDDLWWWIREEGGKRRNRGVFRLGNVGRVRYDLAVTDPIWLAALNLLPTGIYPHALLPGSQPGKPLLTISLSEPFDGFHYKLIAGVINLPS
ncbi:MAG: hypothetical protein WCE75_16120 [Terracidiphilus sp.]